MGLVKYFFIVNARGSPVVFRAFLDEPDNSVVETFYQRIIRNPPPNPVFREEKFNFVFVTYSSLYYVIATMESMIPTVLIDMLHNIYSALGDYMGKCTELMLQRNLALAYEIIDECISFGCPQTTDAANLLHLIHNEVHEDNLLLEIIPNLLFPGRSFDFPLACKMDLRNDLSNEIFLILSETIELRLGVENDVISSNITGICQIKSFLSGIPSVILQLDPQMYVKTRAMQQNLTLSYDDILFSSSVKTFSFDSDRTISFAPSQGTTTLFKYRTNRPFVPPFLFSSIFENRAEKVIVIRLSMESTFPTEFSAEEIEVQFQCPVEISNASCELPDSVKSTQSSEYNQKTRIVTWYIKKMGGLSEFSGRFRFFFDNGFRAAPEMILGPVSLKFTLPGVLMSGMSIANFQVSHTGGSEPKRWVKTVTDATCMTYSFLCD